MLNDEQHWSEFYSSWNLAIPSQFCALTALDIAPGDNLIEFGCGNGRDATCFAMYGANVVAFDASQEAVEKASELASSHRGLRLQFKTCDVADVNALVSAVRDAMVAGRRVFYARFFFHSIDEQREDAVLAAVRELMRPGDRAYCEFRTVADQDGYKEFGQHFRRYIELPKFCEKLVQNGFVVHYSVEGRGMALFKGEDAVVGRVIFGGQEPA